MKKVWCLRFALLIMAVFLIFHCARLEAPLLLEIVGLDKENPTNYSLQIVKADPKDNPLLGRRNKVDLFSKISIHLNEIAINARTSSSFAELKNTLRQIFGGRPADLLFTESKGVYRGTNFESMLGLSAYYHLVEIGKFADALNLFDDFAAGPLRVSLYGDIYALASSDYPFPSNDNALYVGSVDTLVLLPLGENDGLPVPMHEGVLAHEFHHRIFFYEVWINKEDPRNWQRYQHRYAVDRDQYMTRSERLVAATDEGLADIFAVAYTGLPNYLCLSLTTKKGDEICSQRDLNGHYAEIATYDLLASSKAKHKKSLGTCQADSKNFQSSTYNYYCLATVIAKTLYEISDKEINKLKTQTLPAVNRSLPSIAEVLAQGLEYDVDIFFEALAKEMRTIDESAHKKLCQQLKKRFSSLIDRGKIPSCHQR